jgi:hypothetical protein
MYSHPAIKVYEEFKGRGLVTRPVSEVMNVEQWRDPESHKLYLTVGYVDGSIKAVPFPDDMDYR